MVDNEQGDPKFFNYALNKLSTSLKSSNLNTSSRQKMAGSQDDQDFSRSNLQTMKSVFDRRHHSIDVRQSGGIFQLNNPSSMLQHVNSKVSCAHLGTESSLIKQ